MKVGRINARNFKELQFSKNQDGVWEAMLDGQKVAEGETRQKAMKAGKEYLTELNSKIETYEVKEEVNEETDFVVAPEFEETKANDIAEAMKISKEKKQKMWVMANGRRTLLAHSEAGVARQMKHKYQVAMMFENGERVYA